MAREVLVLVLYAAGSCFFLAGSVVALGTKLGWF